GSASNGDPAGTIHRPGPADSTSVHQASLNHGYDIAALAPITLYYQCYYRDPNASAHCGGATFNVTPAGALDWVPRRTWRGEPMSNLCGWVACAFALASNSFAQQSLHQRLVPITAPIRRAGVYHVATGTWTRNASLANVTGPDTIYNNKCAAAYYSPMANTESFQHRSRIPSPS